MVPPLSRIPSGIPGLDRHVSGGIPEHSLLLVTGGIGTGKTAFGLQFLLRGAETGTKGLYITIGPATGALRFAHATLVQRFNEHGTGILKHLPAPEASFWPAVPAECKCRATGRLVIDGLNLTDREHAKNITALLEALRDTPVTVVLLYTVPTDAATLDTYAERLAATCDTVITLSTTLTPDGIDRSLRIAKMRGSAFTEHPLPFRIRTDGIALPVKTVSRKKQKSEVLLLHPYDLFVPQWNAWFTRLAGHLQQKCNDVTFTVRAENHTILERLLAAERNNIALVLLPSRLMGHHIRMGNLADAGDALAPGYETAYLPRSLDAGRYRNTLYGIPAVFDMKQIFFRKDLLAKYDLTPPATWDELAGQARMILKQENDPAIAGLLLPAPLLQNCLVELFLEYLWSAGGDIYSDRGTITLDSPAGRRALHFMNSLARDGIVRTSQFPVIFQNTIRRFHTGRAIFLYHTSELWYCRDKTIPQLPDTVGSCILSGTGDTPHCLLQGACLAAPARTRYPDIAHEALKLAADPVWSYRERKKLGFAMALTPFKKYYTGHDKSPAIPDFTARGAHGCYPAERPPLGEASPVLEQELLAMMTGNRTPERTMHRMYERFGLFRRRDTYGQSVRRAAAFIESHNALPIMLQDIAAQVNVSPRHLNRIFKLHTGHTCIDYLLNTRMERAQQLLTRTGHPVSKVAAQTGYRDQNYFSAQFNKRVGVSPTKYRQLYSL